MGRASRAKSERRQQTDAVPALLRALLPAVRAEVLTVYSAESCIASTDALLRALAALGVPGQPLCVRAQVHNNANVARALREGHLAATPEEARLWEEQEGAWTVGLGYRAPGADQRNRVNGHLVAIVARRWLADPSLDQASRPARGMTLAPTFAPLPRSWPRKPLVLGTAEGALVAYLPAPDIHPSTWRTGDWGKPVNGMLAERALRRAGLPLTVAQNDE